jgi:multiple sugar transport system substrate-binding protein
MIGAVKLSIWRRLLAAIMLAVVALAAVQDTYAQESNVQLNPEVSGEVEFWHFWGSPVRRTAIRRVVAMCEAQLPNIQITEVFKPWGDIWTANIAAVAAGSGMPDVIVADRSQIPRDAAEGIYQNLGEFAAADGIDGSQFWPFTWRQSQYEGEPYGIPFETDVRVMFYNKTLFEQAGLDPENPPETWEELWQAAEALDVVNGGNLERIAFSPLIGNGPPNIWMLNNGHNWIGEDGTPVVNDPAVVETLEWINQWIEHYGGFQNLQRFTQSFSAPPNDHFMSGGVAMVIQTAGYSSILNFYRPRVQLENGETAELAWGVAPIPHAEGAESTSDSGGFTLSIPSGAENPEAAWEFIKCATSVPAQISWARDTYAIPNGPEAANSPELMADPNWSMFIDAIESVPEDNSTFVAAYPNWQSELANRFEQVWTGQTPPEAMVEEAQQAIDAQIESNQ